MLKRTTLLEAYPEFAALEPKLGCRGRAFPQGNYFVWRVKEVVHGR